MSEWLQAGISLRLKGVFATYCAWFRFSAQYVREIKARQNVHAHAKVQ